MAETPAPPPVAPPSADPPPAPPEGDEESGPSRLGPLIAGVALVIIAGIAAWAFSDRPPPPSEQAASATVQTASVVVAARDLEAGELFGEGDAMVVQVDASNVPGDNVFADAAPLAGRVARERHRRGEVIFESRLCAPGARAELNSLVRTGFQVLRVAVSSPEAGAGLSLPGDLVDIFAVAAPEGQTNWVEGVRVLAIGDEIDRAMVSGRRSELRDAQGREVIVLETSPEQAEVISAFASGGGLRIEVHTEPYAAPDDPTGGERLFVSKAPGGYLRLMKDR